MISNGTPQHTLTLMGILSTEAVETLLLATRRGIRYITCCQLTTHAQKQSCTSTQCMYSTSQPRSQAGMSSTHRQYLTLASMQCTLQANLKIWGGGQIAMSGSHFHITGKLGSANTPECKVPHVRDKFLSTGLKLVESS